MQRNVIMSQPVKKKRGLWSESNLVNAMAAIINGELTQRQAAERFKIPRRTLRNHLKSGKTTKKLGRDPILSKSQEKDLVERIVKFSKIGMPLTPQVIRTQSYKFCEMHGIENSFNKNTGRAGRNWLQMFLKRNPNVSMRKAQLMNPARAQKLNRPIVQQHFQEVKKLYDELDIPSHPERLYNIDEKGCRLTIHHQQKVLAEKGNRRVHMIAQEHAENVTIAACVNAAGNIIPPMIVFKGKRLKQEYEDSLPPGTLVKMSPKGSMTTSLFIDFIEHLGKYKSPGKCLLVFDGASCHLDYYIVDAAEKNYIVLYCLPSNTTHELQNKSFESYWDQEVMKFMYHNPTKKLNKARFNPIFTKVWAKSLTPENIMSGFRATGLFPFDPNTIPDDAYMPSLLTEIQDLNSLSTATHEHELASAKTPDSGLNVQRDSDTDVTDAEDSNQNSRNDAASPSLLNEPHKNFLREATSSTSPAPLVTQFSLQTNSTRETTPCKIINPAPVGPEIQFQTRLVEYSSSLDPDSENEKDEGLEFHSPTPGPSGIRNPTSSDSSSSGLSLDIEDFIRHQKRRGINIIYDPYSDSDDENYDLVQKEQKTPTKDNNNYHSTESVPQLSATDDSDDDISLIKLKSKVESISASFKELIPTPNFAVVKSHPRRKALNYKGQRIVKDLFEIKDEKISNGSKGKDRKHCLSKARGKKIKSNIENKTMNRTDNKKTKHQKKLNNNKQKKKDTNLNDKWFCHGCKEEREEDMRSCKKCLKWYHEECVGLTKEDDEVFFCPDCV